MTIRYLHALASLTVAAFVLTIPVAFVGSADTENARLRQVDALGRFVTAEPSSIAVSAVRASDAPVTWLSHAGSSGIATRADGLPETRASGQGTKADVNTAALHLDTVGGTPRALPVFRGEPVTVQTSHDPVTLVTLAAMEWNVDPAWMLRVMQCESGGNNESIGDSGLAVGIFQWHSKTWRQYAQKLAYSMADYGSVEAQARLTAWAFANGHSGLWTCAREGEKP